MTTTGKVYTPVPPPDTLYKKDPLPPLTEKERQSYNEVYQHFAGPGYKLPGVTDGELTEDEKVWLSYECILRFLRGTRWKTLDTIQRLETTLKWRRDFGLYSHINASQIEPEAVTGKQVLLGYDTQGRPALYMIPNKQNSTSEIGNIQFAVFMLERCIDLMPPGVETLNFLITFPNRASQPSFSSTRTLLTTLQTHYPERLGYSIINNIPLVLNLLLKFILAFLDPITRAKCKFDSDVVKDGIFEPDGLMKEWWGGGIDFEYEHERYWPTLIEFTEERRKAWKKRWRELGGAVGIREWLYKRPAGGIEDAASQWKAEANGTGTLHNVDVDTGMDDDQDHHKLQSPWVFVEGTGHSGSRHTSDSDGGHEYGDGGCGSDSRGDGGHWGGFF